MAAMARGKSRLPVGIGERPRCIGRLARGTGLLANPPRDHQIDTGAARPTATAGV